MSTALNIANGFKLEEIERKDGKVDVLIEYLIDGEKFTEIKYEEISREKMHQIVVETVSAIMSNFDIERGVQQGESARLAEKAMALDVINGYKIIKEGIHSEKNANNISVELLKNGKFFSNTKFKGISDQETEELKNKLNNIVIQNLDIHQSRPVYWVEILAIISQN